MANQKNKCNSIRNTKRQLYKKKFGIKFGIKKKDTAIHTVTADSPNTDASTSTGAETNITATVTPDTSDTDASTSTGAETNITTTVTPDTSDTDASTSTGAEANIQGSRIINIEQLKKYSDELSRHSMHCSGSVVLNGEFRYGLASIIIAQYSICKHTIRMETSNKVKGPKGYRRWECNLAAVWAQMSTGGGHSKLQETMSVVGVPVMSKTSFISTERAIGEVWEQQLRETMLEAGREEKQLAIEKGNYHEGVPAITVIVDGGWSKRSHKHSYNAKSGVAIIIGKETGKLLFIGVRNKFCYACSRQIPKDKHDCFKNWNKSSSEMETDIILQGFIEAENVHGLRYTSFVGDGDGSVYSTLLQCVPEWGHAINKVECANHACKCYRGALEKLVKEHASYKGSGGLTLKLRKRLVSSARCAIRMRSTEKDRNKALESLKKDIINGPHHCFGNHSNCSPDFCTTARDRLTQQSFQAEIITVTSSTCMTEEEKENEVDQGTMWSDTLEDDNPSVEKDIRQGELIPQNVDPKMFHDIQVILARLVGKAHQLIGNATTNLAECWMHIRSKFDGGKVINRSQSGSWDHRCMGAGLRQNLGPEWGPDVWRRVTQASPNKVFTDVTASITNSLAKDKKRKATGPAKEQRRKSKYLKLDDTPAARKAYDRHDDGISPDDTTADVSPAQLQIMVESYYERRVKVSEKRVKEIEGSTREQSDSDQWRQERRQRITASKVGSIAKMRETTKKSKKLKKYCTLLSEAMRPHGTDH